MPLYNYSFKKLNKKPIKSYVFHHGSFQIIENNKIKWINWQGKKIRKSFNYGYSIIPEGDAFREKYDYELSLEKYNNNFYINIIRNFDRSEKDFDKFVKDSLQLINTFNIKKLFFKNKLSKDVVLNYDDFYMYYILSNNKYRITEVIDFKYTTVCFQKLDNTFGMCLLGSFMDINEEIDSYFKEHNSKFFSEYQNLQSIEYKNKIYKFKKDNLYMFFPLQNKFIYKKLDFFEGNFARFELPSGQKGWLQDNGKEYLDD